MTAEESITIAKLASKVDRLEESLKNHCEYTAKASEIESKRIDDIHEVDAKALSLANREASERAAALASNVEKVANNVRDLVETTRSALSKSLSELINPIVDRLSDIEKKQYENQGKEFYSDPMMTKLVERMETVANAMSESKGKGAGATALWGYIIGAVGLISAILAIASRF